MKPEPSPPSFIGLAALTGGLAYAAYHLGPFMAGGEIRPLAAAVSALAALSALGLVEQTLGHIANGFDWIAAHEGSGKSGTAKWGKYKDIKKELCKEHAGPFWGIFAEGKKPAFIDFESNAFVIGPSGSGKTHTVVIPLIFLIPHSKVIMDFKPELLAICKKGLEELGQAVIPLAPFGAQGVLLEHTYCLNPLDVITDNLFRSGGLRNVYSDAGEIAMQLYEDPPNAKGEDPYWRNGTRKLIRIASILACMMKGYDGTLRDVAMLLDDPFMLEAQFCSVAGMSLDGSPDPQEPYLFELCEWAPHHSEEELIAFLGTFRAKVRGLLKKMRESEKTFASFLEGAQQAVEPYGFGALSSAMGRTNFNINTIKDGHSIINFFIVGDASETKATEQFFGIMQWFIQFKLKRHPNKKVPVYLINDEASNYSIHGFVSLLTWGRGFGIRSIVIFQNFPAFEERYGKNAIYVLNSESEIKLYLPSQRCDLTIERIVKSFGNQSLMNSSFSVRSDEGALNETLSESGRPLVTEDEARRSTQGFLVVRQHSVFLQKPVSYSEIHPLRELADINPHHGKPFLRKVRLKLNMKLQKK